MGSHRELIQAKGRTFVSERRICSIRTTKQGKGSAVSEVVIVEAVVLEVTMQ